MYVQKRTNRHGIYYSFSYVNREGKRVRLSRDQHPHFTDEDAAKAWAKIKAAEFDTETAKIERRMAWRDKFYKFDEELIPIYRNYQESNAPNSWEESVRYLSHYVFPWFLGEKQASNLDSWHFYLQEFRDYAEFHAKKLRKDELLAYSSKNKIIHAFNSFLDCMVRYGKMAPDNARTCEIFPATKLNRKSYENVIEPEELEAISKRLTEISTNAHDFYYCLNHTGVRSNELRSFSMKMLKSGDITGPIGEELKKCGLKTYGYVVLTSQVRRFAKRGGDGTLDRKPLKGRPKIDPAYDRIIPITDKKCWNILATRWKEQEKVFEKRTYGGNLDNYLLFAGYTETQLQLDWNAAYEGTDYKRKTPHDARHSYCTNFVGQTRSFFLARQILGHKSDAFERYLHIYEKSALMNKARDSKIDLVS